MTSQCDALLRALPTSSVYDTPCFPKPKAYAVKEKQHSLKKLEELFKSHRIEDYSTFRQCIDRHVKSEDQRRSYRLLKKAYENVFCSKR